MELHGDGDGKYTMKCIDISPERCSRSDKKRKSREKDIRALATSVHNFKSRKCRGRKSESSNDKAAEESRVRGK